MYSVMIINGEILVNDGTDEHDSKVISISGQTATLRNKGNGYEWTENISVLEEKLESYDTEWEDVVVSLGGEISDEYAEVQESLDAVVTTVEASEEYGINEDTMRKIAQNATYARKSGATHLIHRKSLETYLLSSDCEVYEYQDAWAVRTPAHRLTGLTKAQAWLIAFQYGRSDTRYQAAIKAANVPQTPDVDMGN